MHDLFSLVACYYSIYFFPTEICVRK